MILSSLVVAVALAASGHDITLDYRGTLGEALSQIASKGEFNLIVTGELKVDAEVHLKNVSAEDALTALAEVHHLEVHHQGALWVVKPEGPEQLVRRTRDALAAPVPPVAPVPPAPPEAADELKALGPGATPEEIEAAADAARDRAEAARDRAEEAHDRAKELREAQRDHAQALAEEAKARVAEVKAKKEFSSNVGPGPVVVKASEHAKEVVSYGGPVTLEPGAVCEGDAVAFGGDVVLGDGAVVKGDAVSFGGVVKKGEGAVVKGEEVSFGSRGFGVTAANKALGMPTRVSHSTDDSPADGGSRFGQFLLQFAALFGLGFLLMMFAPTRMKNIEAEIRQEPVKSGLAGLLALLASVPITIVLVVTVIGIPFALLMWLAIGLALIVGLLPLANAIGARVPARRLRRTQAAVLAMGLLALMLVSLIPVLGSVCMLAALFISMGAIIRTRAGQRMLGVPMPDSVLSEAHVG